MDRTPRFTTLLAASAIGVYLLVVAGATASVADAVRACTSWPTCRGPVLGDPGLAVAWGHRIVAVLVGALVAATAAAAYAGDVSRRVRATLAVAVALYPVQIALGAFVATSGAAGHLPGAHLAAGMAIFVSLVAALAWHLEAETGSDDEGAVDEFVDGPAAHAAVEADDDPAPAAVDLSRRERIVGTLFAYFRLTKPRLMWLLCLVAAAAMALAAGESLQTRTILLTLGGGVLAIGASGTFNHVLERDVDKRMDRTSDRPVATHQIPVRNAVTFGLSLAAASLAAFWQLNALAAALGLAAILFYSVVYTLVLKPNTVQNTVIGGAAGALPALIGWAAVTGNVGLPGLALAGVIFLWTPAHFYNLALAYKEDYAKGGFPMMPVVRGETETRKHICYYLGATLVAAGALAALTPLGALYAATTTVLGAVFLAAVVALHREQTERAAFRAFHASNAYLGALLVAIVVDALAL
ncbi:heme o synthase [Halomicrobium salinisoli]|uniref:heme o synthase n=1 Tax=Halomicrobium salinisoli TaxID=2878391 RepID=UPI001CF04BB2|nr:heme o synthase [Halomicrobium salinisoli]